MKQGTSEWLALRKNHIGASDAPVIMGDSPWKSPYQLWEEKLGVGQEMPDNPGLKMGREMEGPAREAYEKFTNKLMVPEVVFHPLPEMSFMMASLDGVSSNGDTIVEIKNPNEKDHLEAVNGRVPKKYWAQVQHQLECYETADILHYWSFRNGKGALVEVERSPDYLKDLIAKEEEFWNAVTTFTPPPLDDKDYMIIEDNEWKALAHQKIRYDKELKYLKEKIESNKMAMIKKSGGQNIMGHGIKFRKVFHKGTVNYKQGFKDANLCEEKYRGEGKEFWKAFTSETKRPENEGLSTTSF